MLKPKRISAPAAAPVSLAEAKQHLRVDANDDDALITSLINAATEKMDGRAGVLGRCIVTQTWKVWFRRFGGMRKICLPFPDVDASSVVLKYFDGDDVEQTINAADYWVLEDLTGSFVLRKPDAIWPTVYDRPDAISIEFQAGFGGVDDVPAPIKAAILLTVGHLYENREDVTVGTKGVQLPGGAAMLIDPYSMVKI